MANTPSMRPPRGSSGRFDRTRPCLSYPPRGSSALRLPAPHALSGCGGRARLRGRLFCTDYGGCTRPLFPLGVVAPAGRPSMHFRHVDQRATIGRTTTQLTRAGEGVRYESDSPTASGASKDSATRALVGPEGGPLCALDPPLASPDFKSGPTVGGPPKRVFHSLRDYPNSLRYSHFRYGNPSVP